MFVGVNQFYFIYGRIEDGWWYKEKWLVSAVKLKPHLTKYKCGQALFYCEIIQPFSSLCRSSHKRLFENVL